MDILNRISLQRFRAVDDLLAFVSIYEDTARTRAFRSLLSANARIIRNAVCIEGGCGLGIFSIEMARLGARKVYAVEQNPLLAKIARHRIQQMPKEIARRIELVEVPLQQFRPREHVNVLLHEFYGQLLFDEDLWVLDRLRFRPDCVMPDGGELLAGIVSSEQYCDRVVAPDVINQLRGVLVSGLFQERFNELKMPVLRWDFRRGLRSVRHTFRKYDGDLLCLGIAVTHKGKRICEAGRCPNWSYVWTLREGNKIAIRFRRSGPSMDCLFRWVH